MVALTPTTESGASPRIRRLAELGDRLARMDGRVWIAAEIVLIVAYVAGRSLDLGRLPFQLWYAAAALLALASPISGVVMVAAVAPFSERLVADPQLGYNSLLVGVLGVSVGLRVLLGLFRGERPLPRAAVVAAVLGAGALAGVAVTWQAFGEQAAKDAAELWVAGIGGAMIILVAAFWAGRGGSLRPLWVALGSSSIAGVVSLIEFFNAALVRDSPFAWLVRAARIQGRLAASFRRPTGRRRW